MSYRIGNIPSDPAALPQFLQQELARIQELWNSPLETLPLAILYKAPAKPRTGVYLADGTLWDPGEGAGFYGWRDGAYHRLDCPCPAGPANTVAPVAYGDPTPPILPGDAVSCTEGEWTGAALITFTYQWLRDGAPIAGETFSSYAITEADFNQPLTCEVTASNGYGSPATASSNSITPIPLPRASILAYKSFTQEFVLWDTRTRTESVALPGPYSNGFSVALSKDGERGMVQEASGAPTVYQFSSGAPVTLALAAGDVPNACTDAMTALYGQRANGGPEVYNAAWWGLDDVYHDVIAPGGTYGTAALAVSADAAVIAIYEDVVGPPKVLLSGVLTTLGADDGFALAVSSNGRYVVGMLYSGSYPGSDAPTDARGFRYDLLTSTMLVADDAGGGSRLDAVSDAGLGGGQCTPSGTRVGGVMGADGLFTTHADVSHCKLSPDGRVLYGPKAGSWSPERTMYSLDGADFVEAGGFGSLNLSSGISSNVIDG